SAGTPNYDFYTAEVVQRIGYDSFTPDNGVLIAKNKDRSSQSGGPNGANIFAWTIDAHPEDITKLDFKRPNGEPVMRSIADYRQLSTATSIVSRSPSTEPAGPSTFRTGSPRSSSGHRSRCRYSSATPRTRAVARFSPSRQRQRAIRGESRLSG